MAFPWEALPDLPLAARGADSAAVMRAGCRTYREVAAYLHSLPYGRNADRADYRLVLTELRGTCSTKHALLAAVALEQAIPVSLTIGIYDMSAANTPGVGPVLARHGLHSVPEAHCYLIYQGTRIDITRSSAGPMVVQFAPEWAIEPTQVGAYKVQLHRSYLADWLYQHPELTLTLDELWSIREDCIA